MYHYHFTQDFPYTVSCFWGETDVKSLSSGEGSGQASQNGPQTPAPQNNLGGSGGPPVL